MKLQVLTVRRSAWRSTKSSNPKYFNTAPYASLVPVAQDTLITSRILSRSESNTSTFPLLLDHELSGHHKQSLSHAQQWGRKVEGSGIRPVQYGLGGANQASSAIGSNWSNFKVGRGISRDGTGLLAASMVIASFCTRTIPLVSIVELLRCCFGVVSLSVGTVLGCCKG